MNDITIVREMLTVVIKDAEAELLEACIRHAEVYICNYINAEEIDSGLLYTWVELAAYFYKESGMNKDMDGGNVESLRLGDMTIRCGFSADDRIKERIHGQLKLFRKSNM